MVAGLRVCKAEVVQLPHVGPVKVGPFWFRKGLRNVRQVEVRAVPLTNRINSIQIVEALIFQQASDGFEGDR